jgi:hypothetical protein
MHKFKKGEWNPVKKPGSETRRAKEHGRSLHAQEEIDSHSPDKRIRGKGIFGLNAAKGEFKGISKRKLGKGKSKAKKGAKRSARKRV